MNQYKYNYPHNLKSHQANWLRHLWRFTSSVLYWCFFCTNFSISATFWNMVNQENSFGALCEDLLVNILCRLPERDLLKCKCVSVEWLRIISYVCVPLLSSKAPVSGVYFRVIRADDMPIVSTKCPREVKDEIHRRVAYAASIHYIDSAPLTPFLDCFGEKTSADSIGMSIANILPFKHRGPDFLDCCNGLVLLVQRPKPQFYVCNPAIGQYVAVPLPPPHIHIHSLYASLAFDPSESIHYRVVISSLTSQPQCLHVFYSQTGEWIEHEVQIELPKCFQLVRHCVYVKNIVYRLSMLSKILCLDLKSLEAYIIDCPSKNYPPHLEVPPRSKYKPPPGCIGLSQGSLCFIRTEIWNFCVWLLEKPDGCNSEWSLKYTICIHHLWQSAAARSISSELVWIRHCAFHPTADILFLGTGASIWMYHIESRRIEEVRYFFKLEKHCGFFFPIFLHKNTFVTLKNWCRGSVTAIDEYEDVQDNWCFIEQ